MKRAFDVKQKAFFIIFKVLSAAKNCLRPESLPLSDQWTASESEKTGLYGNIYDFLVDYQAIVGVGPIYDMNRYLMTKLNIRP